MTNNTELAQPVDPTTPGELAITPELKIAFIASLKYLNVNLRFFSGSWGTFDLFTSTTPLGPSTGSGLGYDVLLTSETIYRLDSLSLLVELMRNACTANRASFRKDDYLCLVAAKVLYFGVGGGVPDLEKVINSVRGHLETVLERKDGVGRKVMRVLW